MSAETENRMSLDVEKKLHSDMNCIVLFYLYDNFEMNINHGENVKSSTWNWIAELSALFEKEGYISRSGVDSSETCDDKRSSLKRIYLPTKRSNNTSNHDRRLPLPTSHYLFPFIRTLNILT